MNGVTRHTLIAWLLIGLESLLIFVCLLGGLYWQGVAAAPALMLSIPLAVLILLCLSAMQLYVASQRSSRRGIELRVALGFLLALLLLVLLHLPGFRLVSVPFGDLFNAGLLAWLMVSAFRLMSANPFQHGMWRHRVLVLGSDKQAQWLAGLLRRKVDQARIELVGYVALEPLASVAPLSASSPVSPVSALSARVAERHDASPPRLIEPVLGHAGQLVELCQQHTVDEIVVVLDDRRGCMPLEQLLRCRMQGIAVSEGVQFLERMTGKLHIDQMNPGGLIFGEGFLPYDRQERAIEWGLNLVLALAVLLLTLPLLALTAVAIWLEDGRQYGIFYRQPRVGRGGQLFQIFKFRSMAPAARPGTEAWAKVNDPRVTRVGRWIRKLHIDELPQLFNIIRGEMNIVGPRPEQPAFVEQLQQKIPFYHERHLVKPGLTGWAQIRYPYGASEDDAMEKLKYDLFYVKRRSLSFNLQIFLQTIEVVLFTRGAR